MPSRLWFKETMKPLLDPVVAAIKQTATEVEVVRVHPKSNSAWIINNCTVKNNEALLAAIRPFVAYDWKPYEQSGNPKLLVTSSHSNNLLINIFMSKADNSKVAIGIYYYKNIIK